MRKSTALKKLTQFGFNPDEDLYGFEPDSKEYNFLVSNVLVCPACMALTAAAAGVVPVIDPDTHEVNFVATNDQLDSKTHEIVMCADHNKGWNSLNDPSKVEEVTTKVTDVAGQLKTKAVVGYLGRREQHKIRKGIRAELGSAAYEARQKKSQLVVEVEDSESDTEAVKLFTKLTSHLPKNPFNKGDEETENTVTNVEAHRPLEPVQ